MSAVVEIAARAHGMSREAYRAEVDPVLLALFERWAAPPESARPRLTELAYEALGTNEGGAASAVRWRQIRRWYVTVYAPTWLDALRMPREASALRVVDLTNWPRDVEALEARRAALTTILKPVRAAYKRVSEAWHEEAEGRDAVRAREVAIVAARAAGGEAAWSATTGPATPLDTALRRIGWPKIVLEIPWLTAMILAVGDRTATWSSVAWGTSLPGEATLWAVGSTLAPGTLDLIQTLLAVEVP